MMSLIRPSFISVVIKQFMYKMKAYSHGFVSLMIIQLLGLLVSFGGIGASGSSSENFEINLHFYSADIVIAITMLWGFITAILITTKAYRHDDFAFVTNR